MPDVAVALSGGVDSSVAAALLVEAGRNVVGVTMDLGLATAGAEIDQVTLARAVCDALGIPHVVIDLGGPFRELVVGPFVDAYAAGLTPNPCVSCNERVKFGLLATRVRELGVSTLATGHYAQIAREHGRAWLERGADRTKDQSYFLYRIPRHVLDTLEFPLGSLAKAEVRRMAEERGLPTAEQRESQEVCFTGDHVALVGTAYPGALAPGPIVTTDGRVLGTHRGIARYTVGQRKGLGVGGPEGPYRVVRIDAGRQAVIVAPEAEAHTGRVTLTKPLWHLGDEPEHVLAQIRYRSAPRPATAVLTRNGLEVEFDTPADPLAPGQSVVLYAGDRVVGGGLVPAL